MTGVVTVLAADYIALRRRLGYRSPSQERAVRAFARHLDQGGHWARSRWRPAWTGRHRPAHPIRATLHGG